MFGSRKKLKSDDFELSQDLISEFAGHATLLLATTKPAAPRNVAQVRRTPEWPVWKAAKVADLKGNGTWEVVEIPTGEKLISS